MNGHPPKLRRAPDSKGEAGIFHFRYGNSQEARWLQNRHEPSGNHGSRAKPYPAPHPKGNEKHEKKNLGV